MLGYSARTERGWVLLYALRVAQIFALISVAALALFALIAWFASRAIFGPVSINQKLFLVNRFAMAAKRAGLPLPELSVMFEDEALLRPHIEQALASAPAPVVDAARAVATAFAWSGAQPAAFVTGAMRTAASRSAAAALPMMASERSLAQAELLKVVGPIADFIVDQIGDTERMSLRKFLAQAADFADLSADKRQELFAACNLDV